MNTNAVETIIIYTSYTPAQARAQKKWLSNPDNKEYVREYYKRRFNEGTDEYRKKIREQNRERARRAYYARKARELGLDCIPYDL